MPDPAMPAAAAPDPAALPDPAVTQAAAPQAALPDPAAPQAAPNPGAPQAAAPNPAALPDPAVTQAATPEADAPDPATPEAATPEAALPDLAGLVARFTQALRAAGLSPGADRAANFTRAVLLVRPTTLDQLRHCAHATLGISLDQLALLDSVLLELSDSDGEQPAGQSAKLRLASASERLQHKDFGEMTPEELAQLAAAMSRLRFATPLRRSRRRNRASTGPRHDLRATLRAAQRTGGDPVRLLRRRYRKKPRKLVVLCDISGSMEPYARAMLQFVYCAGVKAEVFSFATRLTRLTPALRAGDPALALDRAGQAAPDWSSGTRIGEGLREFIDGHGRAGIARGAVVLVVSDGWDTGDPAILGAQMARLSRLAFRIVWANPRTQSPRFRPLVGGMAAAWPHCDAVVSGHSLAALDDLIEAISGRPS